MANNPPQQNLADILRALSSLAPENQEQSRSQTPEGLPHRGGADNRDQKPSQGQYGTPPPQQPWQPANQPWQPPSQAPWQPPQQQAWQPPQQVMNQTYHQSSTPPQQHHQQQPQSQPHHQQQPKPNQTQMARQHQPMQDPRQVQLNQMNDPHHLQRMKEKEAQRRSGVDPATIIDWPTGLRCVMKTVAMNEKVISEIKKLIQVQNAHETQWYAGRKALIMASQDRAAQRRINQKKAASILKSLGTTSTPSDQSNNPSPEQEAEALKTELEVYDAKVYRAQFDMVREMTGKMRGLGVPFFGTRSELVVVRGWGGGGDGTPMEGDQKTAASGKGKAKVEDRKTADDEEKKMAREKGKISELELVELQRKMLGILQDLCEEK